MSETGSGTKVKDAYRYCRELVRAQDKDRFLTSLYAPAERRPFLIALYAFALEIARVRRLVKEPMTGEVRLQWWLEAVRGLRAQEAAANPVMIALNDAARQAGVALDPLTGAVEARQAELYGTPAVASASAVFMMAARLLGAEDEAIGAAADQAAQAVTSLDEPRDAEQVTASYTAFRARIPHLPEAALPAFLPVALVPLLLRRPQAPPWRRQLELVRTAWFGFPKL